MVTAGRLGVLLLITVAQPAFAQDASRWRLAPDLRIGAVDRPNYTLTDIYDLDVSDDGRIFVAQSMDGVVRVFDSRGRFLYDIGSAGSGPGEFRQVDAVTVSEAGLLVMDQPQFRLTLLSLDGKHIRSWRVPGIRLDTGLLGTPPRARLRDGRLLVIPGNLSTRTPLTHVPAMVLDSAGKLERTIAQISIEGGSRLAIAGNLRGVVPQPVSSNTLWAVPRDLSGIITVNRQFGSANRQGEFHVHRISADGDTVLSRRFRVPVTAIPQDAVTDSLEKLIDHVASVRPIPREQIAAMYADGWRIPEYQAPVDRIIAGIDGSLWLRQGAFVLPDAVWFVLDANGELIATVQIPNSVKIYRASVEHVWGVQLGEFDEPYVVRLRIVKN